MILRINTRMQNTVLSSLSPGPDGVGVNELKRRLLISDPDRYGVTVPRKADITLASCSLSLFFKAALSLKSCVPILSDTTREKRRQEAEGVDYHFVSVHMFEEDILNHRYRKHRAGGFLSHGGRNNPTLLLSFHEGKHTPALLLSEHHFI